MKLLLITGSTRPVRVGPQITASLVTAIGGFDASGGSVEVEVADLAEIGLPSLDEPQMAATGQYVHPHTKSWAQTVTDADAVLFVTPQYNFGYPAALKDAIDYLFAEWRDKPGAIISYGSRGGLQSYEQLHQVLTFVGVRLVPGVQIALPPAAYGSDGRLLDPDGVVAAHHDALQQVVHDLLAGFEDTEALPASGAPAILSVPPATTALVEAFVAAFNAHDADAFADLFTEEAWYVDVVGHQLHGRDQVRCAHVGAFAGPLAGAHLDVTKIESRLVAPRVVHVEARWRSVGHVSTAADAAERLAPEREGLLVLTLTRQSPSHRWAVAAGANQDFTHSYTRDEPAFLDAMLGR